MRLLLLATGVCAAAALGTREVFGMLPDAAHRAACAVGCVGARVGGGCVRAPRVRARACSGTHVPRNDDVLARNDFVLGAVGGGGECVCE